MPHPFTSFCESFHVDAITTTWNFHSDIDILLNTMIAFVRHAGGRDLNTGYDTVSKIGSDSFNKK